MENFLIVLKEVFDLFGPAVFVPFMLFVISLFLKVPVQKAFNSAILAGVGLTGFNMLIGAYLPQVAPIVNSMVINSNINLPIIDTGWQTSAIVAYSTQVGLIFVGVALVFQIFLFSIKWTNIFMPGDLWNNYNYMIWGSMCFFITKNISLSFGLMFVLNLYTLILAEVIQKRWATYYNYPNCVMTAPHHIEAVPLAIFMEWLLNKLGAHKIKWNPETLRTKLGIIGEPMMLGLFLGLILGVLGNSHRLNTLIAWGQIINVGISTAAVLAVFPKVAGIFASAFTSIIENSRKSATKNMKGDSEWYLAVNDAAGYGEPTTLLTGIMLIPLTLLSAFILPGNKVLPLVDLIAIPFVIEAFVCVHKGNIFKTLISGWIWMIAILYIGTAVAPYFTEVAISTGIPLEYSGATVTMIIAIAVLHPLHGLIFFAFLSKNPVIIGSVVVVYGILYFFVKKNKVQIHAWLENSGMDENISIEI